MATEHLDISTQMTMSEKQPNDSVLTIPVLPLRDLVVFPFNMVPLFAGREKSVKAIESALADKKSIFLVSQKKFSSDGSSKTGFI